MKQSKKGLIASLVAGACFMVAPFVAHAQHLSISNNTPYHLTFSVNGACSEEVGHVKARDIKTLSSEEMDKICKKFTSSCEIKGYINKNCSGMSVGGMQYLSKTSFVVFGGDVPKVSVLGTSKSLFFESALQNQNKA